MAAFTTIAAVVAVVASVAAAGVSAYSSQQQAKSQKKAADYNAKVAENNAKLASMQASYDAQRVRDRNRRLAGKQRAKFAKSGVSIVSGSAFNVLQDQEIAGELDVLTTLYGGKVKQTGYEGQARYHQFAGENALKQGNINMAGSLLTGVGSAASASSNLASIKADQARSEAMTEAVEVEI
jgi:hypothetical protein